MYCVTTTTSGPCVNCVHPFNYLFELAYVGLNSPLNRGSSFAEVLDRILDKGIINTNCNLCCPDCEGIYSLASVETQLKLLEALGLTETAAVPALPGPLGAVTPASGNSNNNSPCCSNVYASVETWLKYAEQTGLVQSAAVPAIPFSIPSGVSTEVPYSDELMTCCNGFTECIDDLVCWATRDVTNGYNVIDRILDKGIVEYGGIYNNCTKSSTSSICLLVDLMQNKFADYFPATGGSSRAEIIDRLMDKGITISCSSNGEIIIASVETWLKYGEAVGLTQSAAVIALGITTTTTTAIEDTTTTTTTVQ